MAIRELSDQSNDLKKVYELDNGDLAALGEVEKKWNFKDKESALKFALAILYKSEKPEIFIGLGDSKIPLSPADSLLKEVASDEQK